MSDPSMPAAVAGVGNGLIEIAALTAIIGSTTAASLILGSRGAAGLPWAVMSTFGAFHVVKACVGAIVPGWLRDTLGVRSNETDYAVGWSLDLATRHLNSRSRIGGAVGVACEKKAPEYRKKKNQEEISRKDIYAFDLLTSEYLNFLPTANATDSLQVYILSEDAYSKTKMGKVAWRDTIGLLGSLLKLVEVCILWTRGAVSLAIATGICWAWFFIGAAVLQSLHISREFSENQGSHVDLLTGQLPTPIRPGGERKILLAAPSNHRHRWTWRTIWIIGAFLCTVSVIGCYFLLGKQSKEIVYLFIAFQILWLGLRSIFFHFAEGVDKVFNHPSLTVHTWDRLAEEYRYRVMELVFSLSLYQMHVHPRGAKSYEGDVRNIDMLQNIQSAIPIQNLNAAAQAGDRVKVKIEAIIGDTMLSSAAWTFGSKLTGIDLYDSCIVTLTINDNKKSISIPSARVITDAPPESPPTPTPKDIENPSSSSSSSSPNAAKFPPRGGSNSGGPTVHWNYWIPCSSPSSTGAGGHWLHIRTKGLEARGEALATIVTDAQITKKLSSGELFNSLTCVEEIREIVRNSGLGCEILVGMLRS